MQFSISTPYIENKLATCNVIKIEGVGIGTDIDMWLLKVMRGHQARSGRGRGESLHCGQRWR